MLLIRKVSALEKYGVMEGVNLQEGFKNWLKSYGTIIETNAPYIPQGNAIVERGFGTIIGSARNLLLGAPHLRLKLSAEAVKAAIYIRNRTPT